MAKQRVGSLCSAATFGSADMLSAQNHQQVRTLPQGPTRQGGGPESVSPARQCIADARHIVLTTYDMVVGNEFRVFNNIPRWEVLCVDEGQRRELRAPDNDQADIDAQSNQTLRSSGAI